MPAEKAVGTLFEFTNDFTNLARKNMRKQETIREYMPETGHIGSVVIESETNDLTRNTAYVRSYEKMLKILFVCHGNICRSPMAEFVMKDMVKKAGLSNRFYIESAATSGEEIGNPAYPPARRKLAEHGISCEGHAARQLLRRDYKSFDLLIGMDHANIRNMNRICGGDPDGKIHLLMEYADHPKEVPSKASALLGRGGARKRSEASPQTERERSRLCDDEVADPWYTGDFEATWLDVTAGCQGLLKALTEEQ